MAEICTFCEAELDNDATFCASCGYAASSNYKEDGMSIFDNINRKINSMAVGDDETSTITRSSDPFPNPESVFADQPNCRL